jgi:alpha-tubulin suppressor-like RCC1 family protein
MRIVELVLFSIGSIAAGCGGASASGSGPAVPSSGSGTGDSSAPSSPGAVSDVAAGDYHTCALKGDGTVWCWGRNNEGQLGDGTTEMRTKPVQVAGVSGATGVGVAAHASCALMADKTLTCWGSGKAWNDGQARTAQAPTQVQGIADVADFDGGGELFCVRFSSGGAKCWGDDAHIVGGPPSANVAEVSVEEAHACARTSDGAVKCWGDDTWTKKLGDPGVHDATDLGTGDQFACVVGGGGAVSCWGRNEQGEFGTGTPDFDDHPKATPVAGITGAKIVEAGEAHGCAILGDASLVCWGSNADGELGRGRASDDPQKAGPVTGLSNVAQVALGNDHVCARANGTVSCFGSNKMGQLGDGTNDSHASPTAVAF